MLAVLAVLHVHFLAISMCFFFSLCIILHLLIFKLLCSIDTFFFGCDGGIAIITSQFCCDRMQFRIT